MLDLKEISYQPQTGERKIIDNLNLKINEINHKLYIKTKNDK